jgi:hypothetical protein
MRGGIDEQIAKAVARKEKIIEKLINKNVVKGEEDMSIENSLERIAVALEKIANLEPNTTTTAPIPEPTGVPPVEEAVVEQPKPKKAKKVAEPVVVTPEEQAVAVEFTDVNSFIAHCNKVIVGMQDKALAGVLVQEVTSAFKQAFGVSTLKQLPIAKLSEAKAIFDEILSKKAKG